ncbi:MAG TPA: lipid A export permease/ATP-binding protein MsbA [Chiayiivirga sp.]|nr:lipid A export permease/ATP-binding protein MsbA [Chiayiivirga sp.]
MSAPAGTRKIYRRLLAYVRPYWPFWLLACVGMVFDAAAAGLFTWLIKPMLDELFVARNAQAIFWMPFLLVGLFVIRGVATYAGDYGMARIGRSVVRDLRKQLFGQYQRLPAAYFDHEPAGQIVSRVIYGAEQVAQASADAVRLMIVETLTVLAMVSVMLWHSASLTLYLFVMLPLTGWVWQVVGRRYRRINRTIQTSMGDVTGAVDEAVDGHREIRIYGGQARESERFAQAVQHNLGLNLKIASTNALSSAVIQVVAASALAAIVWRATRPDLLDGMSAGTFMSLISAMLVMLPSIKRLTTVQSTVQRGVAAAEEMFEVLDRTPERDTGTRPLQRARGELQLRGVSLRYPGRADPALDGIDLECPAGSITALVGPSGSGKSSLVSLLPRFYEPDAGEIQLDGHALADYRLTDLRAQIALVSQRVVLFNGSIADNIAYGGLAGASRERIRAAAEAANAMEFIERLPEGLDSPVGEHGALLSGGQRQRIAIARALLKDAPILILDEATSALDTQSERLIQDAMARLMVNRTTLVIAHRLSTVEHADQIVVLERGRIVERGRHADLLARAGTYAALHQLQFRDPTAKV